MAELRCRGLNVWYGAAQALFDVSLAVGAGELGGGRPNGAGKIHALQAVVGPSSGRRAMLAIIMRAFRLAAASARPCRLGLCGRGPPGRSARAVQENLLIAARGDVAANLARALGPVSGPGGHAATPCQPDERRRAADAGHRTHADDQPETAVARRAREGIAPLLVESDPRRAAGLARPGPADAGGRNRTASWPTAPTGADAGQRPARGLNLTPAGAPSPATGRARWRTFARRRSTTRRAPSHR